MRGNAMRARIDRTYIDLWSSLDRRSSDWEGSSPSDRHGSQAFLPRVEDARSFRSAFVTNA